MVVDQKFPVYIFPDNEGLAMYEARQMRPGWRARIREKVADREIPSLQDDFVPDTFDQVGGLAFSTTRPRPS